jgi:hypothetical protein
MPDYGRQTLAALRFVTILVTLAVILAGVKLYYLDLEARQLDISIHQHAQEDEAARAKVKQIVAAKQLSPAKKRVDLKNAAMDDWSTAGGNVEPSMDKPFRAPSPEFANDLADIRSSAVAIAYGEFLSHLPKDKLERVSAILANKGLGVIQGIQLDVDSDNGTVDRFTAAVAENLRTVLSPNEMQAYLVFCDQLPCQNLLQDVKKSLSLDYEKLSQQEETALTELLSKSGNLGIDKREMALGIGETQLTDDVVTQAKAILSSSHFRTLADIKNLQTAKEAQDSLLQSLGAQK